MWAGNLQKCSIGYEFDAQLQYLARNCACGKWGKVSLYLSLHAKRYMSREPNALRFSQVKMRMPNYMLWYYYLFFKKEWPSVFSLFHQFDNHFWNRELEAEGSGQTMTHAQKSWLYYEFGKWKCVYYLLFNEEWPNWLKCVSLEKKFYKKLWTVIFVLLVYSVHSI